MSISPEIHAQWAAVLAACIGYFCWVVRKDFGTAAALLLAYAAGSALYVWVWKNNRYVTVNPYDQMALRYFACDSIAKALAVCVPLMHLSRNRERMHLLGVLVWGFFAVFNSLSIVVQGVMGCKDLECGGLIGNPSISMGATICMLPLFVYSWRRQWFVVLLVAVAAILSRSSVAVGLLVAYACLHMAQGRRRILELAWPAAMAAGFFGVARLAFGSELLNDSDRFALWKLMLQVWSRPENVLNGMGLGTYHVMSVNIQAAAHFREGMWWNTMHNEPLQFLFECGAVGFLLFAIAYGSALLKTLRSGEVHTAMSVALFGLYMTLDPALHFPVPAFFGAWLFVYALRHENTNEEYL